MESIRVADSRLNDVLNQKQANYKYPFFWIRTGETDKIINELNQIYNSVVERCRNNFKRMRTSRDEGLDFGRQKFSHGFCGGLYEKELPRNKKVVYIFILCRCGRTDKRRSGYAQSFYKE